MRHYRHGRFYAALLLTLSMVLLLPALGQAQPERKQGALVYVPAYSQIYQGAKNKPFLLTVVLMIRNIDPQLPVVVESVQYVNADGEFLNDYRLDDGTLGPLAAKKFIVDEKDDRGGSGAGFLVRWRAETPVNPPLIETVMVSTTGGQGISFVARGIEIAE